MSSHRTQHTPALVAGLCSHGLAVCRALARRGIAVTALESDTALPGFATRRAKVVRIAEVNGESLVPSLIEYRKGSASGAKPVLFLTNDNMVKIVAEYWDDLSDHYQLSWAPARQNVLELLDKSGCERYLRERNYPLPATWLLSEKTWDATIESITFPAIAKPSRPLGEFKALRLADRDELTELAARHPHTPLVVQEWIPGGDEKLFFSATVARHGEPLCFFDGTKYLSHPPARGQTVVAGPSQRQEIRELVTQLARDTCMSGPMSIEVKLDPAGGPKIIEPTVGRTDFWAQLAIINGTDLPYIEYMSVVEPDHEPRQVSVAIPRVWFDSEKDPASVVRLAHRITSDLGGLWLPGFSYLDITDPRPFGKAMGRFFARVRKYLARRLPGRESSAHTRR